MKRVLYIEIYRNPDIPNGFDIRTAAIKRYLAEIAPGYDTMKVERRVQFSKFDLYSKMSLPFMRGYELNKRQLADIHSSNYDVIVIGSMELAPILTSIVRTSPGSRIVFDMRDVLSRQIHRDIRKSGVKNFIRRKILEAWQSHVMRLSHSVLLLSEDDTIGGAARHIHYVNNGAPAITRFHTNYPEKTSYKVGFVSDFSYPPNIEGAKFLNDHVASRVPSNIEITLFGRGSASLQGDPAFHNLRIGGPFSDIDELYTSLDALVAPIFVGSGIKNKVVEGLFAALPVFTTAVGNEGIGGVSGRDLIIFEAADQLTESLAKVFSDPALRRAMGSSGRQLALDKFSDSTAISRLNYALEDHRV